MEGDNGTWARESGDRAGRGEGAAGRGDRAAGGYHTGEEEGEGRGRGRGAEQEGGLEEWREG